MEGLKHKKRSVSDLIRFISNTSEINNSNNPNRSSNYSILLGAGASISSGIRSGQELVRTWKKEVYDELCTNDKMSEEEFFKSPEAPEWYEANNEYSSLFENRYDLQRHRRIFVEQEVGGKSPSLGYAYLVNLIEKGFFNTVFTTNFDDLLNEAFYRFSKKRPIVCAHDSSISSVSITSVRPKIIKLHGDYLFDDIKATMRETESLETNMKMKFQEFAKDFGLIVVGYAGNDRSIMDILAFLLQHEDYFKNGIYWCLREEDIENNNINGDLRKLLWRDRVFYVPIKGFDELFAEINYKLNSGDLPIDDEFLSRAHQEKVIKALTENDNLDLSDEDSILYQDCERLKSRFNNSLENDYLKYVKTKKNDEYSKKGRIRARRKNKLKKPESIETNELKDLIFEGLVQQNYKEVLKKIEEKNIFSLPDSSYKLELLRLTVDLNNNMKDHEVLKYFKEIIRLSPEDERFYVMGSHRSKDVSQKLEFLNLAVVKFPNDYFVLNEYIKASLNKIEDYESSINDKELKEIEGLIDKSLNLFPYIENNAYLLWVRYKKFKLKKDSSNLKDEINDFCEELITKYPYHCNTLAVLREAESTKLSLDKIEKAIEFYLQADNDDIIEKLYIEKLKWLDHSHNWNEIKDTFREFEENFYGSDYYKIEKGKILKKNEYFEEALKLFKSIEDSEYVIDQIMSVLSYIDKKELDHYYNSLRNKEDHYEVYLKLTENIDDLILFYRKKERDSSLSLTDVIQFSFCLLKKEEYSEVIRFLQPYYDNPSTADGPIIINYQFAYLKDKRNTKDKIKTKIQEKIIDNKFKIFSDIEKLGAYCLLENEREIVNYLSKVVKKDPLEKYSIKEWPIMKPYLDVDKIKKLLIPKNKKWE